MSNNSKFSPGDMIGGYTLTAFCGVGGFGEVYLAKDKAERKFALKIALDAGKSKKEFDGLQKLSDCRNPHLIEIKHIDYHERKLYYTMDRADNAGSEKEYVADTLALRISKGALPADEVYSIAEKIAEALACLHNHPDKLIHRDIKPDNIIFVKGEPVLIDVGLITTTKYDVSCGYTPGYVPGYISKGNKTPCRESDFYALGITLQCALTGMNNPAKAKDRYIDATTSGEKESKLQNLLAKLDQDNFDKVTIHSAEDFLKCLHGNERKKESTAVKSKSSAGSSTTKKDYRTLLEELYEQDIYTAPNIPEKKLKNALRSFAPGVKAEDVLLLADDTAFGSAKEGVILTKNALYGKEMWEKPKKISLFRNTTVSVKESKTLCINNYEFISLTLLKEKFPKLRAIIQAVCASHSDSFDGVCKPEILPKQKSGCLKKILIFSIFWILLGIIGNYLEEKEKNAVNSETGQIEKKSATQPKSAAQQIQTISTKAENMPEIKKLLNEYKLSPAETIRAEGDSAAEGYNENIKMILDRITRKGNYSENDLAQLRAFLYARKRHFASQPSKHVQSILRGE